MSRAVLSAVVCDGKKSFNVGVCFYIECFVCNVCVESNLNHLIVYLIIYAFSCYACSARWWSVGDDELWVIVKCGWLWSVGDGEDLGCTTSKGERAVVLFRFPFDAERYVRGLMQDIF